ncbi:THUMP-like domain-containing protein [Balneola sp. MJW-20]|uniref:class I SAM-dependent methyltransferase n=1 Tax=Gracilimonas aurantiaca TaxID=3234185 RepID=UPI003465E875
MHELLTRPDIKQFIREHEKDDVAELMLNRSRYPELPMTEIAGQIKSRRKAKDKLPEWYANENVIFPPHHRLQQSSSELTARYKASFYTGDRFLDLTGGTGIDSYYLLEKFQSGVIVEPDPEMAALLRHNLKVLGIRHAEVLEMTAENYLQNHSDTFDLIYLDPSRRDEDHNRVFLLEDCSPDVIILQQELIKRSEQVLIKASPMLDHHLAAEQLNHTEQITILSVEGEVKELLYHLRRGFTSEFTILCKDIGTDLIKSLEFKGTEEDAASVEYRMPGEFLYDPMRTIRKAGAFKLIGEKYDLQKLEVNTHLYTSDIHVAGFPGRTFKIIEVLKIDRKLLRKAAGRKQVNLATRNYATDVSKLRKKLGVTDGGTLFAFAAQTLDGYRLILCKKV